MEDADLWENALTGDGSSSSCGLLLPNTVAAPVEGCFSSLAKKSRNVGLSIELVPGKPALLLLPRMLLGNNPGEKISLHAPPINIWDREGLPCVSHSHFVQGQEWSHYLSQTALQLAEAVKSDCSACFVDSAAAKEEGEDGQARRLSR